MSDTELLPKSEPVRRLEVFTGAGRRPGLDGRAKGTDRRRGVCGRGVGLGSGAPPRVDAAAIVRVAPRCSPAKIALAPVIVEAPSPYPSTARPMAGSSATCRRSSDQRAPTLEATATPGGEHPVRMLECHYRACAQPPVTGPTKRNSATRRSVSSPEKRSSSDAGRRSGSIGGMKEARAACQNRSAVKPPRHHARPALNGGAVDADDLRGASHPGWRHAVPHDRHQHHDRGEIDLAAEKAQRGRRRP
jgi:hypothetical protein